jgi:hypothetical protein
MPATLAGTQSATFSRLFEGIPPQIVATLAREHDINARGMFS